MNELGIVLGLMFVLILLIFVILVSIAYHIVDLGVDMRTDIWHSRLTLDEIKRINKNIYFKLDNFKEEDDGK